MSELRKIKVIIEYTIESDRAIESLCALIEQKARYALPNETKDDPIWGTVQKVGTYKVHSEFVKWEPKKC